MTVADRQPMMSMLTPAPQIIRNKGLLEFILHALFYFALKTGLEKEGDDDYFALR